MIGPLYADDLQPRIMNNMYKKLFEKNLKLLFLTKVHLNLEDMSNIKQIQ